MNDLSKAGRVRSKDSPLQIVASADKLPIKPLLLIDLKIAEAWDVPPANIPVYSGENLASINVNKLGSGQINSWNDICLVEPQDLFLNSLTFIDLENALPGSFPLLCNQPILFRGNKVTLLLPLNSLLLNYLTVEDLMQRVRIFQANDSNTLQVTLKLPLIGINSENSSSSEYEIHQEYLLDEQNILEEIPVLEIWPNIQVENWQEYYAFYYNPSRNNQCFDIGFDNAQNPHIFSDDIGSKYQITQLDDFPSHINCFHNDEIVGFIPIKAPVEIYLDGSLTVGVDFGKLFTNVYINNNGMVEQFKPGLLHLQITNVTPQIRIPILFEYFIPESFVPSEKPFPLATLLTTRQSTKSKNLKPFYDGRIYIPDAVTFRPESEWIEVLCESEKMDLHELFLKNLVLTIIATAAQRGVKHIQWKISYPTSFSKVDFDGYTRTWQNVVEEFKSTTPIVHNTFQEEDLQSESLCIAQYFADREGYSLTNSVCINIDKLTSDISIWQKNTLLHQCSIQVTESQLLTNFLERYPELVVKWFEQDQGEWSYLQGRGLTRKLDELLRRESESWLQKKRRNVEKDLDFQYLLMLIALGISGLYYYVGKILATLKKEGKYNKLVCPSILIGGNNSQVLHWISTAGKFTDITDVNKLFNRILSQSSGLAESAISAKLSCAPGDEVACGLVLNETKLGKPDIRTKNLLIAGESCYLNYQKLTALDRVGLEKQDIRTFSLDEELCNLKEFVEMFNHSIKDLDIDIPTMKTYELGTGLDSKYNEKLWVDTNAEIKKSLLNVNAREGKIFPEAPFTIGLKALLEVLIRERGVN